MKTFQAKFSKLTMTLVAVMTVFQFATAQDLKLDTASSELIVYGTSNVHDWDIKAETIGGTAQFIMENNEITNVGKLHFTVVAESLKSGKSGMDKNTYKALNTSKHKNITYQMTSCISVNKKSATTYEIKTRGNLTISGVTKQVPLTFKAVVDGKKVTLSGETNLTMTTYNVEPPTALLGTIKTGDAVTIKYKAIYN